MYRRNFRSRAEAYEYTRQNLPKAKKKTVLFDNYSAAIQSLPCKRPTTKMIPTKDITYYRAFNYTQGKVKADTIYIHEDGSIDI